jgi:sulfatase modifying factor 1
MAASRLTTFVVALAIVSAPLMALGSRPTVAIPAGSYRPLYRVAVAPDLKVRGSKESQGSKESRGSKEGAGAKDSPTYAQRRRVAAFQMDVYPVTNAEYLELVRAHPEWQRSHVSRLFADTSYLHHWQGDLELGSNAPPMSPVVYVSWFAARAFLKAAGEQLPTVDQWEYVGAASETQHDASRTPAFLERLRDWYGRPTPDRLPAVGSTLRNAYGVSDMHGLVWEWTLDFNSSLVTGESRADSSLERSLYCGSGTAGASGFEDYAAFMRYAFRSSLEAKYTVANLGFRGVRAATKAAR